MTNSYNWSRRKLTYEQAQEIRDIYWKDPDLSYGILAKRYNVSVFIIYRVLKNLGYNHPIPTGYRAP